MNRTKFNDIAQLHMYDLLHSIGCKTINTEQTQTEVLVTANCMYTHMHPLRAALAPFNPIRIIRRIREDNRKMVENGKYCVLQNHLV